MSLCIYMYSGLNMTGDSTIVLEVNKMQRNIISKNIIIQ